MVRVWAVLFVLVWVCAVGVAHAKGSHLVEVLLSTKDGTPTPQEVIDSLGPSAPPGKHVIDAFAIVQPVRATYLLPVRASGQFQEYLNANPHSARGICKHCGLAMAKMTHGHCDGGGTFRPEFTTSDEAAGVTMLSDSGMQVINMSFGGPRNQTDFCAANPHDSLCLALAHASYRDIVMVGASGNNRTALQFPARDIRVISVGGFSEVGNLAAEDPGFAFWDESPGSIDACPNGSTSQECGSNYTTPLAGPKQELVAAAHAVLSTTYPGKNWSTDFKCGDSFGPGGGTGLCTGTSMSAPQVSGLVGILRSINPLIHTGRPIPAANDPVGIRTVLAQTTVQAQSGQVWSPSFGYGRPDAAAAAARILGKVEGHTVRNRVTPLFRFHSSTSKDYLDTTTPQMAIAFSINQAAGYTTFGALAPDYPVFPTEPNTPALPLPRASVYVLTTEYGPREEWPALVPLYMIERTRNFPVGCTSGAPGCNSNNRDFTLVTTKAHIEKAHADGYSLRAIQGYIYQICTPEPKCIPPGAQKFYRACKTGDDDCATFLEGERSVFESNGYVSAYPIGSNMAIGYAYPAVDSDSDGLIDGFEYVVGTRPDYADTDGDGMSDGAEFPMVAVAASDPCSGAGAGNCPADVIFRNGF